MAGHWKYVAVDHAERYGTSQNTWIRAFSLLYFIILIFPFRRFEREKSRNIIRPNMNRMHVNIRESSKYIEILNTVQFVSYY